MKKVFIFFIIFSAISLVTKDMRSRSYFLTLRGHLSKIEALSKPLLTSLNYQDSLGYTALHYTVNQGSLRLTHQLLLNGANVNMANHKGITPLHIAAMYGMVRITRELIAHSADVNAQNSQDKTPLMYAVRRGNLELCKILLEAGADPLLKNKDGETAFQIALDLSYEKITSFFLSHYAYNFNLVNKPLESILYANLKKIDTVKIEKHSLNYFLKRDVVFKREQMS